MTNEDAVRFAVTVGALAFAMTGGAPLAVVGCVMGYRMYERLWMSAPLGCERLE